MEESKREKEKGVDFEYLSDALDKKKEVKDNYLTPGFEFASQLFCSVAKSVIENLGPTEGAKLLKAAVEYFGKERGKRIAERVTAEGKPLTFKNWLIYTDIDSNNFRPIAEVENGDFIAKIKHCTF